MATYDEGPKSEPISNFNMLISKNSKYFYIPTYPIVTSKMISSDFHTHPKCRLLDDLFHIEANICPFGSKVFLNFNSSFLGHLLSGNIWSGNTL